jgi:hypothetical protein
MNIGKKLTLAAMTGIATAAALLGCAPSSHGSPPADAHGGSGSGVEKNGCGTHPPGQCASKAAPDAGTVGDPAASK